MPAIDYSKWDDLDTDSEGENIAPPTIVNKPAVSASSSASKKTTSSNEVEAVIVRCDGEQGPRWEATELAHDHSVFDSKPVPISHLIGLPVVIHRLGTQSSDRAALDNQAITYLNIDPNSGLAPPQWQSHIGTVVVARKDKKPLSPAHYEGLWMFCSYILDLFGDSESPPTRLYSKAAFEKWWKSYVEEQKQMKAQGMRVDDDEWASVQSPFDV